MIICGNCQSNQLDGTIFCSECGASLLLSRQKETTVSFGQPENLPPQSQPQRGMTGPIFDMANGQQPTLTLVILNSGRRIPIDVAEEVLIGRRDEARGIIPAVDLSSDGGYDAGVSRRHAIIALQNGVYCVADLSSANGTFVNGRRLDSQTSVGLRNGDELKCGMLLMRVELT